MSGATSASSINSILALQAAGAMTSTVGSYYSAISQKTTLESQANIADINARMAESSAQSALQQGQQQEISTRLKTAQLKSVQRVALAANGIDLGSDSAINTLTTTDVMGEIDANTINANAVRTAFGYRTQATNDRNEAMMRRATASSLSPIGAAVGTLLTESGKVASSWYTMKHGISLYGHGVAPKVSTATDSAAGE